MLDTLPAAIIADLATFGRELEELIRANADAPLGALEAALEGLLRDVAPRLLAGVIAATQTSLQPATGAAGWPCGGCGRRARVVGWRERTLKTTCGETTFERPWCHCAGCGGGFSPTDRTLELVPQARLSAGLAERVIRQGARTSFAEAATTAADWAGHALSGETIRRYTEARGRALREAEVTEIRTVERTREAAGPVEPAPGDLVVQTDGVLLRYRNADRTTEFHEVKVGEVLGYLDGEPVAPSYVAARETSAAFGPRLLAEAARRGALEIVEWVGSPLRRQVARLRLVAVVGDGAKWIWVLAGDHFDRRIEILDYYHAVEHLWTLARAAFTDEVAAATWVQQQKGHLLDEGSAPLLEALPGLPVAPTAEARNTVRVEKGYFRSNARRLDYPTFRALGLPIGSGAIESTARHLVQQRLKLPGASWSDAGADAVIAVRCRLLSGRSLAA